MRRSRQILLTIIITAALLLLAWAAGNGSKQIKMANVVVARCDIPAGSQISADQLTTAPIPVDSLADCYFENPADVIGSWTATALALGELVGVQHLTKSAAGLQYPDPGPGRRLLTINPLAADANGFWLAAGSRIDIYLIPRNRESVTETQVMENIRVMAVIAAGSGEPITSAVSETNSDDMLICLDLDIDQARLISSAPGIYDIRLSVINELPAAAVN